MGVGVGDGIVVFIWGACKCHSSLESDKIFQDGFIPKLSDPLQMINNEWCLANV